MIVADREYTGKTGSASGVAFVELVFLNVESLTGFRYTARKDHVQELGIEGPSATVYEITTKAGDNFRSEIVAVKQIGEAEITIKD